MTSNSNLTGSPAGVVVVAVAVVVGDGGDGMLGEC